MELVNKFVDAKIVVAVKRNSDIRVEECHGLHTFDDGCDKLKFVHSVVILGSKSLDITKYISQDGLDAIKKYLEEWD